jgi:DNA repair protein RAD16
VTCQHLECSQLCLSTEVESEPKSDSSMEGESSPPAKLITGIASLKAKDQVLVSEYMAKNTAEGVLDERTDIAEDHYSKKTRMPEKDPSPYLTAQLLPYQREALAWMVGQEESKYKGGILADEMGMGKTLQAISLILENLRVDNPTASKGKKSSIIRGGTLVVCPVVAVMQWKSEIERFVEPNRVSVYIHHGAKRDDLPSRIASHDIVLTTYSIIENEVRKTLGWSKVACKYCKKKYLPEKLVTHNKYFCGPNAKKTLKQDKQQRKAPRRKLAAGEEASDEDDNDDGYPKKPAPKSKARNPPKKAAKKNVIDESSSDDDAPLVKKVKGKSPLHEIHWTRIVLDEAHYIKDRNCNTARGVFELKSEFKWCLTGKEPRVCLRI